MNRNRLKCSLWQLKMELGCASPFSHLFLCRKNVFFRFLLESRAAVGAQHSLSSSFNNHKAENLQFTKFPAPPQFKTFRFTKFPAPLATAASFLIPCLDLKVGASAFLHPGAQVWPDPNAAEKEETPLQSSCDLSWENSVGSSTSKHRKYRVERAGQERWAQGEEMGSELRLEG